MACTIETLNGGLTEKYMFICNKSSGTRYSGKRISGPTHYKEWAGLLFSGTVSSLPWISKNNIKRKILDENN